MRDPKRDENMTFHVFYVLDVDDDLNISEEEFIKGCMKAEQMVNIMGH